MGGTNFKMDIWGAVYALLSRRVTITSTAMGNISRLPGEHFGRFNSLAMPHMTDEDMRTMTALVADLTQDDIKSGPAPATEQGTFWLAFYKSGGVSGGNVAKSRAGRPAVGKGINWDDVDWAQSNAEIARQLGCAQETVRVRRGKK